MTDAYESSLSATLRSIAEASGHNVDALADTLDVKDLALRSGVPPKEVRALLGGRKVDEGDLPERIRQRLHLVRRTNLRPDGKEFTLAELADFAGTSRQWLTKWWIGPAMPNLEHAEKLRRHFGLRPGFLTATPEEALNAVLQEVLSSLEGNANPQARMRDAGIIKLAERAASLNERQRASLMDFAEFLAKGHDS
ncbi:helix-turn-helix transcriptional regulator [Streptomyces mirabilis]|uniref:helix-turn-helix transcriptional regulator n=1 Tax=Streptomyces mirabilis TaxID=68239 RepID=UPI0033CBB055